MCPCKLSYLQRGDKVFCKRSCREAAPCHRGWLIAAPWGRGEKCVLVPAREAGGLMIGKECTQCWGAINSYGVHCYPDFFLFFFFFRRGSKHGEGEEGSVIWPDGAVGQRGVVIKHTLTLWSPWLCIWLLWRSASCPHRAHPHINRERAQAQVVRSLFYNRGNPYSIMAIMAIL